MRKALIAYKRIYPDDAVGYDAIEEVHCLESMGWDVRLFGESVSPSMGHLVVRDPWSFLADKSAIVVYHHAVLWEGGLKILALARCRRVVKYHNTTPAHFFLPYSMSSFKDCTLARRQNHEISRLGVDMVIADSGFNSRDFANYGMPEDRLRVVAPFNRIKNLLNCTPDAYVLSRLNDGKLNVFFVGRVAPNKGHLNIIYLAQYYKIMYGAKIRFIMAGGLDQALASYYIAIRRLAFQLGVDELIEFVGQISTEELSAYLSASDVFIMLSDHEGFCLPIIEAQTFDLPILARESSAISETAGDNQLVYEKDVDFETLASALRVLYERSDVRSYLVEQGKRNAAAYATDVLRQRFLGALDAVG